MTTDPVEPLRIGVLGAARIAERAIAVPAQATGSRLVAVAARDPARAEDFARTHGVERVLASYADVVADPEVEVVYNPLPNALHGPWNLAAVAAGKHVLSEKPFASNAEEAAEVRDAARAAGVTVMEGFHHLYHPVMRRLLDLVDAGELGDVVHVEATIAMLPPDDGDPRWSLELGGGALMDLGCYPAHWLRTTFRAEPTVRSAVAVRNPLGADLSMTAELDFPDGMSATLSASMAEGVTLDSSLEVRGSRGRLLVENLVFPSAGHRIRLEINGVERESTVAGDTTYDHQLAAVVDALASGSPLPTEGADSVATMRLIDAVYTAAGFERG